MATKKPSTKTPAQASKKAAKVVILMGSANDGPTMRGAGDVLAKLGIPYEVHVTSAHRTPERTHRIVERAEQNGAQVFIAGAGWAAHLAGVVAALTQKPVIGVPIDSSPLDGLDALLSTVQMPPGVPVATVATGSGGAKNAAWLAARILALRDARVAKALAKEVERMAESVVEGDAKLKREWAGEGS